MLFLLPPKFPSQTRLPFPSSPKLKVVSETDVFPSFVPKEVHRIKDPFARSLSKRIQRLPVSVRFLEDPIMSSCVKPMIQNKENPVVLLHGFDSSCLEWRYTYPLLEEAGYETWAFDILGWGFSDLEKLPSCDVVSKRDHFYQFWKSHIKKAMILVGPSLGSAVAIDFAVNYPEAVEKLVLIDASVYAEGTGNLATLPRAAAYAGLVTSVTQKRGKQVTKWVNLWNGKPMEEAYVLKSTPLRLYANFLSFTNLSFGTSLDWTNVGRLHCLFPWWEDATVDFMTSGGYNVVSQIKKVKQKTLIIWGENDRIISNKLGVRLHCELPDAVIRQIPDCGHLPHVERPDSVVKLIVEFVQSKTKTANECVSPL
ncbi:uncharacterized protein LOC114179002 isoform X2 [Vigna unguiculata]|uniref:uncharacterized protein LOC114179002 isoform X2 n=1 Tax=Vigna unguiculata TaxID=3917 RepID=UPI0010160F8C|nr:uncharacterized protein LOC114179002 isoform X2 [Vigna unguiculata]